MLIGPFLNYLSVLEKKNLWTLLQELKLVGDQDNNLVLKGSLDTLFEDLVGYLWVYGTEWIVEKDDVSIGIDSSCKTDSGLLTP